jgi:carnitine-CoA ligase
MRADLPELHPFVGMDVPHLLMQQCERDPSKPFIIWAPVDGEGSNWSYVTFVAKARAFAKGLETQGVKLGDRVILHMTNRPEFLVAWFACSWIGATCVTTNVGSGRGELCFFANHSGASVVITERSLESDIFNCGASFRLLISAETEFDSALDFSTVYAPELADLRPPDPSLFNSIMYTSGTTSRPKAVVHTHANMLFGAKVNASHFMLRDDDIAMVYLPLFHLNALGYTTLSTLWAGGTIVLLPKFSATRWWNVAQEHRCTWTFIGPFVPAALKDLPPPKDHSFRFWGGARARDEMVARLWRIPCFGVYGMTETISQPVYSQIDRPSDYPNSVGWPATEYELRLVDEDNRNVAIGETGRLLVRGQPGLSLFWAYLDDPAATQACLSEDGWFDTGDMLKRLPDGSLQFADRQKDMMKVGGENVACSEVEEVIASVAGVVEVAVVGGPHPFLSEVPIAFVVTTHDHAAIEAAIHATCARELGKFKRPQAIRFIAQLPRLTIGKLDRKVLRDQLKSEAAST